MNETEIRKYAMLMRELDLTGMEINEKSGTLRLEREKDGFSSDLVSGSAAAALEGPGSVPAAVPAPAATAAGVNLSASALASGNLALGGLSLSAAPEGGSAVKSVQSPIVGVFYAAPEKSAEPYVKVGDTVKKGSVLGIIEAMKLMNEVVAETDGVIEEICARDGQVVEYGTELFRIKEQIA